MQKKSTKKLKINVNEKTFEEGFEDFIISCRVKNLSEATIKGCKNEVYYSFCKFFDTTTQPISCINSNLISRYILYLQERGLKDITVDLKQDFDRFSPLESVMIKNTKIKLKNKADKLCLYFIAYIF